MAAERLSLAPSMANTLTSPDWRLFDEVWQQFVARDDMGEFADALRTLWRKYIESLPSSSRTSQYSVMKRILQRLHMPGLLTDGDCAPDAFGLGDASDR